MLNRETPMPLYHQVKTVILREIEAGIWKPDARLPTESSLSERFKVSKITVRQALGELASLGYIRREQGRGTFVRRPPLEQGPRELTGFSEEMRRHGLVASSDVLESGAALPPADVAATLRIAPERTGLPAAAPAPRRRRADGPPDDLPPDDAGARHRRDQLPRRVALRRVARALQPLRGDGPRGAHGDRAGARRRPSARRAVRRAGNCRRAHCVSCRRAVRSKSRTQSCAAIATRSSSTW